MNDNNTFRQDFDELCGIKAQEIMIIYDAGFGIKRFSYSDSLTYCRKYVHFFHSRGVKPGDTIVGILPNSPEAILCFFACMLEGVNYAPLPCTVKEREFNNWISIVKPALVIRKAGVADYETDTDTVECACDGGLDWLGTDEEESRDAGQSSKIYLMTSGTTGDPKAMCISGELLWQSGQAFMENYGLTGSGIRFWNYLPMSYLGGLFNLALIPLCCGGSFVISEPFSGKTVLNFWDFVKKHSIDALWFVPSIVQGLLKIAALVGTNVHSDVCEGIRVGFLGTAPVTLQQKAEFEETFGIRLYENFALSETTFLTAENNDNIRYREQGSVGEPLSYISMKLVPIDGSDETGTIWVKTPYIFEGYLSKDGTVDIELDDEGYFNTKDLGHLNDDGILVLDGRDRDIIKKGGLFVSLVEVERTVKSFSGVEEAVAVPVDHDFYGESFVLYVKLAGVSADAADEDIKKLHMWMIDNIVSYKIPDRILAVDDFPRTASGKIQKKRLLEEQGLR